MWQRLVGAGLVKPLIAAAIGVTMLVGLGTWQMQRKAWKEEVIATIGARAGTAPLAPERWEELRCLDMRDVGLTRSCEYRAVRLRGTFLHERERLVYTIVSRDGGVGGPGYWVMTPFRIAGARGSGDTFYVSRGFVPEANKEPGTRVAGQIAGEVEIVGLLRSSEPRGTFTPDNDRRRNVYYVRAPGELGEPTGRAVTGGLVTWPGRGPRGEPVAAPPHALYHFVDLLAPPSPEGMPRPTAGRIEVVNRHLEYALTWYGLALTLLGVFGAFAWGRLDESTT